MLSAVWRRVEDHRRHRGACGDSQDPHASGLARARAMQSRCVEFSPLGSMQSPKNHASGELAPNTARLTACRAGDIVAASQKKRLNFLFAAGKADTWTKYREPFFLIDELQLTGLFKKAGLKK